MVEFEILKKLKVQIQELESQFEEAIENEADEEVLAELGEQLGDLQDLEISMICKEKDQRNDDRNRDSKENHNDRTNSPDDEGQLGSPVERETSSENDQFLSNQSSYYIESRASPLTLQDIGSEGETNETPADVVGTGASSLFDSLEKELGQQDSGKISFTSS